MMSAQQQQQQQQQHQHSHPPPISSIEVPPQIRNANTSSPPQHVQYHSSQPAAAPPPPQHIYTQQPPPPMIPQQQFSSMAIGGPNNTTSSNNHDCHRTQYSNSTGTTGSVNLLSAFPPADFAVHQQQQQQQQQMMMLQHPESAPWTLGSTDGTYAMSLILQDAPPSSPRPQPAPPQYPDSGVEVTMNDHTRQQQQQQLQQQQQQQQKPPTPQQQQQHSGADISPYAMGAAIAHTGEADHRDDDVVVEKQRKPLVEETNPLLVSTKNSREAALALLANKKSLYQDRLFRQPSACVEAVLAAACEVMGFDIAEMWLRTGPKTHQLTNSHLRPTALEDSVRKDLVDVYYGEKSNERTHRLSPALCKRAKEAADVVWVTAHNPTSEEALRYSISNVRTAVAVPVCHQASNTNITILFFSIRRIIVRPTSVEFLVHMSLAAGVASVNSLADEGLMDRHHASALGGSNSNGVMLSRSEHVMSSNRSTGSIGIKHQRAGSVSVTGAPLDLLWRQLSNVEYLTDGGNSWIHTAVYNGKPVVVKTLKPECQDVAVAINEIEGELSIHSRLHHTNIVSMLGAGLTSKGVRFFVLERLDGGTLTQMLGYETRIRDRRRRFWRKKVFSFVDVLRIARSIAEAMTYCHESAIPGCIVIHRDLKPDNIGFTLDGTVKILDFGLAKVIENASVESTEVYQMSGETGSLRYMAPEVAEGLPYNHTADVYSFGIILWELNTSKKPYDGLNRELFYERIVHGGERPHLNRRWPSELTSLMSKCWDADMHNRPRFRDIVKRLDGLLEKEKGGKIDPANQTKPKKFLPKISGMIDRHSTWF